MKETIAYTATEIQDKIDFFAEHISSVLKDMEGPIMVLCVLKGGCMFFKDLVSAIDPEIQLETGFCRVKTYHDKKKNEYSEIEMEENVSGKNILIVDDICDSGQTLLVLERTLRLKGAKEVQSVVAIHRVNHSKPALPTWSLFRHQGEEWFYGYGMDKDESGAGRNYPHIYKLEEK